MSRILPGNDTKKCALLRTAFEYDMYEYMYVTLLCKVIILYQMI